VTGLATYLINIIQPTYKSHTATQVKQANLITLITFLDLKTTRQEYVKQVMQTATLDELTQHNTNTITSITIMCNSVVLL